MKAYYVKGSYDSCYYVRSMLPLTYNGWDGFWRTLRTSKKDNKQMFEEAVKSDIIVFHRPIDRKQLEAAKLLQLYGKKVVFDNDDTYMPDSGVPTQMFGAKEDRLRLAIKTFDGVLKEFAAIADLVTVSTEFLAEEYRLFNKNVVVLPNQIDPIDWRKPKRNQGDKVRIGLVGSVASNQDYKQIIKLLDVIKGRDDVQLVLFALPMKSEATKWAVEMFQPEYKFWADYKPEWHHLVQIPDYMTKLNSLELDIMLIPRANNYFNRAKSNIKFLEASMCEIPVIAQGFSDGLSPYQADPEDAKHMIICHNDEDWLRETLALIEDKSKRIEMGKKAHEYVLTKYNIQQNAHRWHDAYKTIYGK